MQVVGYTDRLNPRPGETIRFMVSCEQEAYRADIVRLIHGDEHPAGPGFKEELVQSPASGQYPGRRQPLKRGSYVAVPDAPPLRPPGSFTLHCWIYPTTPASRLQGILTKWSGADSSGYGLFVDAQGSLALWIGDGSGTVDKVSTGVFLRARQWYSVAGIFDAAAGRIRVTQELAGSHGAVATGRAAVERDAECAAAGANTASFLMAACGGVDTAGDAITGHYNGKIDGPSLFSRALSVEELAALASGVPPGGAVAAWDLGRDFSSATVTDGSPYGLHGQAVNMPARAVTGHNWSGREVDFRNVPQEYAAIYFHDDDLEDAGWEVDFELTIPGGMRSGIYAARLRAGDVDEDYVPFFVPPKRGTASSPIAFLAPTNSYVAYANFHVPADPIRRARWKRQTGREMFAYPVQRQDRYVVENKLLSLYDRHTDTSGVAYSSRLRPNLSMRPKYIFQMLGEGKGGSHQFNADLHLVDWMEAKGFEHDVVTDENLHFEGAELLAPYRVVVTGSHPEYWSGQMLDALEAYLGNGGRLMYLGGNGFYWVTTFAPDRPHVIEVRRCNGTRTWETDPGESHHSTTGEQGGLWRARGRPPQKLTGVGFTAHGFDKSRPYRVQPDAADEHVAFILEGVDWSQPIGDFGLVMGGAGGFEVDRADEDLGTPPHAAVVATASGFSDAYQHAVEEVLGSDSKQGGSVNPLVRGDMVYFDRPAGGAVFSVGSITWCGSLSHNGYDNNVSRITDNVLSRFAAP